jgi:hypothetical protein
MKLFHFVWKTGLFYRPQVSQHIYNGGQCKKLFFINVKMNLTKIESFKR